MKIDFYQSFLIYYSLPRIGNSSPEIELPHCRSMTTKREKVQPSTGGLDAGALRAARPVPKNTQM